jgi:hypothetical protein
MAESWVLDCLSINDGTTFRIDGSQGVDLTPPRQRQEWIGAADSEWQALVRGALHENREIVIPLEVVPQATKNLALDKVGQIVDKLQSIRPPSTIALVWTPHNSSRVVTFDVLAGEVSGLPLDLMFVDNNLPRPTIRLVCKPYWRGTEVTGSTASSSTPFVTQTVSYTTGDVPALGRLIVTDTASQPRRHVEWGLENQYYNASTSYLIDSDDMTSSPTFSGASTSATGAYDPNASGNNALTLTLTPNITAIAGTSNLSHIGTFRVKARVGHGATIDPTIQVRFAWQAADEPWTFNEWATMPTVGGSVWHELDLGSITVSPVLTGTQRWQGRVEARTTPSGIATTRLDYLVLIPTGEGYGKARAVFPSTASGVLATYDGFTLNTAGTALNGEASDAGATWSTTGDATDFVSSDDFGIELVSRATTTGTNGRFATLGSASTDTMVEVLIGRSGLPTTNGDVVISGVKARYTNTTNYLRGVIRSERTLNKDLHYLQIAQIVAGTQTTLASSAFSLLDTWYRLRLVVYATGRVMLQAMTSSGSAVVGSVEASSSVLATAGTLASGTNGLWDLAATTGTAVTRYYDDYLQATPMAEPIVIHSGRNMQIRHEDTIRQDSAGTYVGRPPSYRGSRFLVPPGTSRVMVKAKRNDVDVDQDANVTDATQIQIAYTPRGLAVPRS